MKIKRNICTFLYYGLFRFFPTSYSRPFGSISRKLRYLVCKGIFEYCGKNVNVERLAFFGKGDKIRIGENSGLGYNCVVPNESIIGNNVMMGPNCYIISENHNFERLDIPMIQQGVTSSKPVKIEDDVWIGRNVTITAGRTISQGSIIAAQCVLTKDYPAYSIIGGNPSRIIKSRK